MRKTTATAGSHGVQYLRTVGWADFASGALVCLRRLNTHGRQHVKPPAYRAPRVNQTYQVTLGGGLRVTRVPTRAKRQIYLTRECGSALLRDTASQPPSGQLPQILYGIAVLHKSSWKCGVPSIKFCS